MAWRMACAYGRVIGDVVGLKVSHDFDGLDDGEARILTLKDSRILDNEGSFFLFHLYPLLNSANRG